MNLSKNVKLAIIISAFIGAILAASLFAVEYNKKIYSGSSGSLVPDEVIREARVNGSIVGWNTALAVVGNAVSSCNVSSTNNDTLISLNCFKGNLMKEAELLNENLNKTRNQ